MYTRCPKCLTCFRVTDRHLAIANGKVRCGQCQHVFNAPQHAIDDPVKQTSVAATAAKQTATSAKPATGVNPPAETTTVTKIQQRETVIPAAKEPPAAPAARPIKTDNVQTEVKPRIPVKPPAEIKTEARIQQRETVIPANKETLAGQIEPASEKAGTTSPYFDADATMIADISSLKADDIKEIDLDTDTAAEIKKAVIPGEEDDDIFDDSIDLNAAIEELTQENYKAADKTAVSPNSAAKSTRADSTSENIFSTDAYDATNATSVADVLKEIGQLSLDIPSPETANKPGIDDSADEFDFFSLDDDEAEDEEINTSTDEKSIEEQFLDEFDLTTGEPGDKNIDVDELFDEVDLSDFDDDEATDEADDEINNESIDTKFAHSENNEVPFQLRDDINRLHAPRQRRWHPVFSILFIMLLLLVSFVQLAYFRSYEIATLIPASRPLLETFCAKVHCVYSGPRDINQIQLVSRDVRLHTKEKKALLISATMINKATFAQPYPDIHIRLSDISGNIVAERVFNAKTYMGKLSNPFLLMKSQTPVHLNFEVVDPGRDAVNFEFTFQ